jgi:hypothetical protein
MPQRTGANFAIKYFGEFETEFEIFQGVNLGPRGGDQSRNNR